MADNPHGVADEFTHLTEAFQLNVEALKADPRAKEKLTMEKFAYEAGILALRVRESGLCPGCASNLEMQVGMAIINHDAHENMQRVAADVATSQNNMPKEPTHPGSDRKQ